MVRVLLVSGPQAVPPSNGAPGPLDLSDQATSKVAESCEVEAFRGPALGLWQALWEPEARTLRLLTDHLSGLPFSGERAKFTQHESQPRTFPEASPSPDMSLPPRPTVPACLNLNLVLRQLPSRPLPWGCLPHCPPICSGLLPPWRLLSRSVPEHRGHCCPPLPRSPCPTCDICLLDAPCSVLAFSPAQPGTTWSRSQLSFTGNDKAQRGHRPGSGGPRGELGLGGPAGPSWRPENWIYSIAGGLMQFHLQSQYQYESFSFFPHLNYKFLEGRNQIL